MIILFASTPPKICFELGVLLAVLHGYPSLRDYALPLILPPNLDKPSRKGQPDLLTWWHNWRSINKQSRTLYWSERAIDQASANGHVAVLQWWKEDSGLKLKWTCNAVDLASQNGHVAVLEWWRLSGLEMSWTISAIEWASANGHVAILEWWHRSGLPLRYRYKAIDVASGAGHVAVLQWWKDSGLELRYSEKAMDDASESGHIDVLNWWKESGLALKYTSYAWDTASWGGRGDVLEWWQRSGLELKISRKSMDHRACCPQKALEALDRWKEGRKDGKGPSRDGVPSLPAYYGECSSTYQWQEQAMK
ncbi:hypothetical protein HDV00_004233 [Rhizophlyctis rosea]|nr:hypothetical protein HDV00_004233 [Rhizophlyctis rosea]